MLSPRQNNNSQSNTEITNQFLVSTFFTKHERLRFIYNCVAHFAVLDGSRMAQKWFKSMGGPHHLNFSFFPLSLPLTLSPSFQVGDTQKGKYKMGLLHSKDEEKKAAADSSPPAPAPEPTRAKPTLAGGSSRILSIGDLLFLNTTVPLAPRASTWSAVYLSHRDGKSFTKLVHSVRKMKNTLILVKDDGGHVFAMFCADEWKDPSDLEEEYVKENARAARERRLGRKYEPKKREASTNFFGDGNCALLGVQPEQALYRPTRINENFMYLQTSWPEQDMNGIAMGGLVCTICIQRRKTIPFLEISCR